MPAAYRAVLRSHLGRMNTAQTLTVGSTLLNLCHVHVCRRPAEQQSSLEQKQRLQQVLFPQGIEYADGVYRTQEKTFLFKGLEGVNHPKKVFGSADGNRTRIPALRGRYPNR